jgi:hypothetical protein
MEQQNRLWQYLVFPHVTDEKTLLALRLTCTSFRDFLATRTDCSLLDPRLSWPERAAGFAGLVAARRRIETMQRGKLREVATVNAPPCYSVMLIGGRVVLVGDAMPGKPMVEEDDNGQLVIHGLASVRIRRFWGRGRKDQGGPIILLDRFIVAQVKDDSLVVIDCVSGKVLPMPGLVPLPADERDRSVLRGSGNRFLFGSATVQLFEIAPDFQSVHFLRSFRLEGEWGLRVALVHRGKTLLFKRSGKVTLSDSLGGPEVEVGHIQYGGDTLVSDFVFPFSPLTHACLCRAAGGRESRRLRGIHRTAFKRHDG